METKSRKKGCGTGAGAGLVGTGLVRLRLDCKRERNKKSGADIPLVNGGGATEPRDLRKAHNRRRGRPSEDEDPSSLANFGIIHAIANEAAQEREGGATEPPVANE